jgi:hypothetical protein
MDNAKEKLATYRLEQKKISELKSVVNNLITKHNNMSKKIGKPHSEMYPFDPSWTLSDLESHREQLDIKINEMEKELPQKKEEEEEEKKTQTKKKKNKTTAIEKQSTPTYTVKSNNHLTTLATQTDNASLAKMATFFDKEGLPSTSIGSQDKYITKSSNCYMFYVNKSADIGFKFSLPNEHQSVDFLGFGQHIKNNFKQYTDNLSKVAVTFEINLLTNLKGQTIQPLIDKADRVIDLTYLEKQLNDFDAIQQNVIHAIFHSMQRDYHDVSQKGSDTIEITDLNNARLGIETYQNRHTFNGFGNINQFIVVDLPKKDFKQGSNLYFDYTKNGELKFLGAGHQNLKDTTKLVPYRDMNN